MKTFTVVCHASEEIVVSAETEEEAERIAIEESNFQCIDYCDIDQIE